MDKRSFLKTAGVLAAGVAVSPALAWKASGSESSKDFALPPLGYAYNALEPVIDAMTMEIHHSKHHQAYVDNLNKAVGGNLEKYGGSSLENLCINASADVPAIRNNAGGHFNHSLFWNWIKPGGAKAPSGELLDAINVTFGSLDEFQKKFAEAAKTRFGSGWAWLSVDKEGKLFISSTPNQDNPLMAGLVEKTGTPILGLDVWEHAYYLHYQNRRPDYIAAFWGLVNWDVVAEMYKSAK